MEAVQLYLQNIQGTDWQGRLLFFQENADTYKWVFSGLLAFGFLVGSLWTLWISRSKFSANVGMICFIPIVNLLVVPICMVVSFLRKVFRFLFTPKKSSKGTVVEELKDDEEIDLFS